ncbi:hypothetical protein TI39_contig380g00010 [Zymoseptoria brevis]|uniref:Zn(2)-C6 fungal-type domain-containing protein n=1 Tax=Zymoseptoria brevis TaxID=1047168 RepID=A0A0F4GNI0_9PEZI|nr:hypothetical protein TI39_contig380g00010 [Zymoseptoria brevis]
MDPATTPIDVSASAAKRKRSPSVGAVSAPAAKSAKTSSQLSINYLARQSQEDLPLINKDDTLQNLLHLLSAYGNILDRHESLASNLGARPLGPILIKRFERCFESPPKIVASHSKGASGNSDDTSHQITWLEVIEFARSHPGQFTLSTFSEGRRVCQFYYPQKQLRVQISEEDFLFINSGRCQELIPPLPIWEDEEKEVGTCDVLEAKLKELTNAADMVAARTRQLSHRLKGRRAAILERRAEGGSGTPAKANALQTTTAPTSASSPDSGFVAVNSGDVNGRPAQATAATVEPALGSNAAVRTELLRHFESLPHNQGQGRAQSRHSVVTAADLHGVRPSDTTGASHERAISNASSLSPVPPNLLHDPLPYSTSANKPTYSSSQTNSYAHRPSSSMGHNSYGGGHAPLKHNFSRPLPPALESSQPFRPLCQAHMDGLPRGDRVLPPCDRCRRLRMDCIKNLTSCAGCTRKHARCHWRDVNRDELGALDHLMDAADPGSAYSPTNDNGYGHDEPEEESDDDDSNPLEDLEALGEKEEQENQIREDEEGLRNARELARQGFEDSVRSTEALPADSVPSGTDAASHEGDHSTHANGTSNLSDLTPQDAKESIEGDQIHTAGSGASGKPKDSPNDVMKRHNYDPVHDGEAQSDATSQRVAIESAKTQAPSRHGGFRAVNEVSRDGNTTVNGNGWRPS